MADVDDPDDLARVLADTADYVDVTLGLIEQVVADGRFVVEKDYRVEGEVWRVHKGDADPYPSRPHAHCVGGAPRFIGMKLHLGTAAVYRGREATGRFLSKKQFGRLIALIQPKFPDIRLPLAIEE